MFLTRVVAQRVLLSLRMQFQPVVISGPSGTGKSTLVKKLMAEYPGCFAFSVSHTTRKPRPGECEGKDYHFVTKEEFETAIENNEFVEYAIFSGNMYGTSKKAVIDVQKTGRICILDIDMQGVKSIKETDLNPRYIFIKPPDMAALRDRLLGRNTETDESLKKRMSTAQSEMDYGTIEALEKGAYDHTIVNKDLDVAYEKLKGLLTKDIDAFNKEKFKSQ